MDNHYRIQLYWPGRTDSLRDLARQLGAFLAELGPVHPGLAHFLYDDKRLGAPAPAGSLEACEAALEQGTIHWRTGSQERISYERRFFIDRKLGAPVAFTLTCGIEPLGLGPIFAPNRLEFLVRAAVGDERASRPVLEAVLRSAVNAWRPDWGFAGTEWVPAAPQAVFSDGTPVIGWMTYFRSAFPPIPRTLPAPAVPYPVASLGTLVVAHPELFDEHDPAQRASIERVREVLTAAGVLVPPGTLPPS